MTIFGDNVAKRLEDAASVFKDRSGVYKDNYKVVGDLIAAAFPDGVKLQTAEEFQRWHILELMFVKLARYTNNYSVGGHEDSLTDLAVYTTMLSQIDADQRGDQAVPPTEDGNVAPEVPGWDTDNGPVPIPRRLKVFLNGEPFHRFTTVESGFLPDIDRVAWGVAAPAENFSEDVTAEAEALDQPDRFLVQGEPIAVGDMVRLKGGNLAREVVALGPTPGRIWCKGMTESIHGGLLTKAS